MPLHSSLVSVLAPRATLPLHSSAPRPTSRTGATLTEIPQPLAEKRHAIHWRGPGNSRCGSLTALSPPLSGRTGLQPPREGQQSSGFVRPAGSFDGVHFVGQSWVSVWVFDMGDGNNGVVLVDALNNPGRRQGRGASGPGRVRVQGLRHQGRLISITHEHADHDGGLRYLQDTVGMPAYATKDAWEGALGRRSRLSQGAGAAVPERDPDGRAGAHVWQHHLFRLCTRLDTRRER